VLRRVVSALALLSLVSAPVVGRTRLFCRYTGVEITGCAEQESHGQPVVQVAGCCDRQVTRALGVIASQAQPNLAAPVLHALPAAPAPCDAPALSAVATLPAVPTGPPLLRITRALLI
jgi:hypothetical protein